MTLFIHSGVLYVHRLGHTSLATHTDTHRHRNAPPHPIHPLICTEGLKLGQLLPMEPESQLSSHTKHTQTYTHTSPLNNWDNGATIWVCVAHGFGVCHGHREEGRGLFTLSKVVFMFVLCLSNSWQHVCQ